MEMNAEFAARIDAEGLHCVYCTFKNERSYCFHGITFTFVESAEEFVRGILSRFEEIETFLRFVRAYEIKEELGLLTDYEKENLPALRTATTDLFSLPWLEGVPEIRVEKKLSSGWKFFQGKEAVSRERSDELERRMRQATELWAERHDLGCIQPSSWLSGHQALRDPTPPLVLGASDSSLQNIIGYRLKDETSWRWLRKDDLVALTQGSTPPPTPVSTDDSTVLLFSDLRSAMEVVRQLMAHPAVEGASTWLAAKGETGKLLFIDR